MIHVGKSQRACDGHAPHCGDSSTRPGPREPLPAAGSRHCCAARRPPSRPPKPSGPRGIPILPFPPLHHAGRPPASIPRGGFHFTHVAPYPRVDCGEHGHCGHSPSKPTAPQAGPPAVRVVGRSRGGPRRFPRLLPETRRGLWPGAPPDRFLTTAAGCRRPLHKSASVQATPGTPAPRQT